jgi:hypothetical protein
VRRETLLLAELALFHERRDVRVEASLALAPLGDGRAVTGLTEALVHLQGRTLILPFAVVGEMLYGADA